jgi:NAD(P)-dependent dehydrogenase (short-subunit alcohol dehydrogenase family)
MIRTQMTAGFDEAAIAPTIPLGRFGEASEVANVILYLVSDRGRFVTGAELVADGGWIAQ